MKLSQLTWRTSTGVIRGARWLVTNAPVLTVVLLTHAGLWVVYVDQWFYLAVAARVFRQTATLVGVDSVDTSGAILTDVGDAVVDVVRAILAGETWLAFASGKWERTENKDQFWCFTVKREKKALFLMSVEN